MIKIHQLEIEPVIHLILAVGIGLVLAFYNGHKTQFSSKAYLPSIQTIQNPTPTPFTFIPKPQVTSQISPDGARKLTMTVTTNKDLTRTYTFVTSDSDGTNQQMIYAITYAADSMSIPFNTWSPDNKYIFIMHVTSSGTEALIMRADGQPLTDTESNFNATTIFNAKNTGNAYQETTGWASYALLIINTKLPDGSKGPSYWLEIPSKTIIQLSSQF
jgi:hypothetical protein